MEVKLQATLVQMKGIFKSDVTETNRKFLKVDAIFDEVKSKHVHDHKLVDDKFEEVKKEEESLDEKIEKAMQLEKFNNECANRKIGDMHANFTQMYEEHERTEKKIDEL